MQSKTLFQIKSSHDCVCEENNEFEIDTMFLQMTIHILFIPLKLSVAIADLLQFVLTLVEVYCIQGSLSTISRCNFQTNPLTPGVHQKVIHILNLWTPGIKGLKFICQYVIRATSPSSGKQSIELTCAVSELNCFYMIETLVLNRLITILQIYMTNLEEIIIFF